MERDHILRNLVASIFMTGIAAGLLAAPVAASATDPPISACGTISASGSYSLTKSIGSAGNCLAIAASNVSLNLNGFSVAGTGVGRGIDIRHTMSNVQVVNGQVRHFAVGVLDGGTNTTLQKLTVVNNSQSGIALVGTTNGNVLSNTFPGNGRVSIFVHGGKGASITRNHSTGSGRYSVWVKSATQFTINGNQLSQSGIAGIIVSCSNAGITNTLTCPHSTAGTIAGNRVTYDRLGIAIDRGNTFIHVSRNTASLGGKFDLFDSNPACGTDTWSGDTFTKRNRLCIH